MISTAGIWRPAAGRYMGWMAYLFPDRRLLGHRCSGSGDDAEHVDDAGNLGG